MIKVLCASNNLEFRGELKSFLVPLSFARPMADSAGFEADYLAAFSNLSMLIQSSRGSFRRKGSF
jgi:hypothetical protein